MNPKSCKSGKPFGEIAASTYPGNQNDCSVAYTNAGSTSRNLLRRSSQCAQNPVIQELKERVWSRAGTAAIPNCILYKSNHDSHLDSDRPVHFRNLAGMRELAGRLH